MFRHEDVFVKPGAGVRVPLPIPGGGSVPAEGANIERTLNVERLIRSGDLIDVAAEAAKAEDAAKAAAAQAKADAAAPKAKPADAPAAKVEG